MSLAARVARSLEEGRGGAVASAVAELWGAVAARSLVKPLVYPASRRVIVVGGATLGGSGKTPLAIECARYLASVGESVAFVGHGYGATPGHARVVGVEDDLASVGDEGLVAARALAPLGVPVVIAPAPARQASLDLAVARARVVVVDGVAQVGPVRAHLAVLAVDARRPWGAGACPPRGDLRAVRGALVSVCDRIAAVGDPTALSPDLPRFDRPIDPVATLSPGAWLDGKRIGWSELQRRRVGLWTAIARPKRIATQLAKQGVVPRVVAAHGDHASGSAAETAEDVRRARHENVDLWLCTAKCAVHLPADLGGIRVAVLDHQLTLGDSLSRALRDAVCA